MEQRVEALIRRVFRRHRFHEFGIDDCENGHQIFRAEADLFFGFEIGNHAPAVHFRTGSGGGGNGDDGDPLVLARQGFARAARNVIPKIAVVGRHRRDSGGTVENRAAAERENEIATVFSCDRRALHDRFADRIFHDLIEYGVVYARFFQFGNDFVERAVRFRRFAVGNEQQSLFAGKFLFVQRVQFSAPEDDPRRVVIVKIDHRDPP